jgi:phage terminase large subunit-like protein
MTVARADYEVNNDLFMRAADVGVALSGDLRALYFPDTGPFARHLFPKSLEFFEACGSRNYKVLSIFGGNRTSKTFTPSYAIACWVTGEYPDWWDEVGGLRFEKPIRVLCSGATGRLVRDSIQLYLFGTKHSEGDGCLIPARNIKHIAYQNNPEGLAQRATVRGRFGESIIDFSSDDAGRKRFQSTAYDVVLLDEEHDAGVFSECVTRTGTTKGFVINAFTALKGVTPLVALLLPQYSGQEELNEFAKLEAARWHTFVGWDDIPYSVLSQDERRRMRAHYLPHEILARTTGIPTIGAGMVWPMTEVDLIIPAFRVPEDWPQLVSLDPGFDHGTGALRWALDQDDDALYIIADHWKRLEHYAVHAERIKRWGEWLPIAIDYASGLNAEDGEAVKAKYRRALPNNPIFNAVKSWHAGATEVFDRMRDGRLFVFDSCRSWLSQYRQYVRNEKGKIALPKDPNDLNRHHFELMDCTRYGALAVPQFKIMPAEAREKRRRFLPDAEQGPAHETIDVMKGMFG